MNRDEPVPVYRYQIMVPFRSVYRFNVSHPIPNTTGPERTGMVPVQPVPVPSLSSEKWVTGEPLIQRKDDTAEVLKSRLDAFHRQTEPVINYYSTKGVVASLHAEKPPKEVTSEVKNVLSS
ncbi:hypothetical protein MTR67_022469 [Solanum verrucosum]|uniref:adenylate kinase n=1 Tax=Solanum verrucosum TaxID=315347 RepID=A0AAF0QRW4_SOLVR|nr:hypothetical protein MTR67_022469 [Solanum verrucosum]